MTLEEAKNWWAFQPLPNADAAPSPAKIDADEDRQGQTLFSVFDMSSSILLL